MPVLASAGLAEVLDCAGLDDAQRQLAASMFDNSQLPMFAAKRRCNTVHGSRGD